MNSTNCPTEDVLLDYAAGNLDSTQAALFELHANVCARCSALRGEQSAVWQLMDDWKPAPVSEGFNRELWRRIDAEAKEPSWKSQLAGFSLWKRVAPLAFGMLVVVTAFVWDHSASQSPKPVATPAAIVVTVSEADQLERALDDVQLLDEVDAASAPAKTGTNLM